jgi:hypothetical protein
MRKTAASVMLIALLFVPALAQDKDRTVERAFPAGGVVNMDLSAAGYRLTGVSTNQIRVSWRTRKPSDERRVRVSLELQGNRVAFLRTYGPKEGLHFDIDVPQKTTLNIDLSAGDLQIRGIEGSKDVSVWAGDVGIEVGDPAAYRRVNASVRVGDLDARPFSVDTGGIFRSLSWDGKGAYELRARLFAGDLKLLR